TGMKQRVNLAQALAGDPKLLLLDEPTNGLDPAGRTAMLELIARIGEEFGISILVASHLLGEIERICDHLVAIEAGRLLRADTIDSFTKASQTLVVEVEEGLTALQAELARRGLRPRTYQRSLLVPIGGDGTYDAVRDSVAGLALALTRMERRRHQVEELFRDAAGATGGDTSLEAADARCPGHHLRRQDRRHPRPRLPPLRRPAPGPGGHYPRADLAQLPLRVRLRQGSEGQGRAGGGAARPLPARPRPHDTPGPRQRAPSQPRQPR